MSIFSVGGGCCGQLQRFFWLILICLSPVITHAETRVTKTVALQSTDPKLPLIGMVLHGLENPVYQKLEESARQYCRSSGLCRITSGGSLASVDDAAQRVWLKQLIAENVQGLIIAPSGGQGLVGQLVKAKKKGIPVINIGGRFDAEKLGRNRLMIPWVGPDNTAAARAVAQLLVQRLPSSSRVAIVAGPPGHQVSYERVIAAKGWLKSNKMKVVAIEAAHWQRDRAETVTLSLLEKYPDLDAVMAMSDEMALGVIRAVDQVKPGGVLVTGFDGEEQVINFIRTGKMLATIDWYADQQGVFAIKKLLAGTVGDMKTPWRLLIKEDLVAGLISNAGRDEE